MKMFLALQMVVFGIVLSGCGSAGQWDSMSRPDIHGRGAMTAVESFIATNGWNMQSNGPPFEMGQHWRTIRGLPWRRLKDREFAALTQNGILYVLSNPGWHHDSAGVAYNPQTNRFGPTIRGFKPIGSHWYVWFQPEFQSHTFTQQYE